MTVSEAYFWTTILLCTGLFQLSAADLMISLRHRAIMNFRLAPEALVSRYMRVFQFAYDGIGAWLFKILTLLCALACIALVVDGQNPKFLLATIFVTHLLSYPRWRHFVSSDSPLFRAMLIGLMLHYFFPSNIIITQAGLLFIATYLVLVYHLTAIQKLKSQLWRNGQAMENFMNRFPFWRMVSPVEDKPKWLIKAAAWSVMLFELCFFLGFIWPEVALVFFIAGLTFHGVLSFTVGINHFFWTFIAAYPVYLCVSGRVPEILTLVSQVYQSL